MERDIFEIDEVAHTRRNAREPHVVHLEIVEGCQRPERGRESDLVVVQPQVFEAGECFESGRQLSEVVVPDIESGQPGERRDLGR